MKLFATVFVFVCATALPPTAAADAALIDKETTLNLSEVYVPSGLSSRSEAFVVVSGMFPNGCYKWLRADVTAPTPLVHEIRAVAAVTQTMCPMVITPFSRDVQLGRLQTGTHMLRFINGDGTYFEKVLRID